MVHFRVKKFPDDMARLTQLKVRDPTRRPYAQPAPLYAPKSFNGHGRIAAGART
jgi:hypothetical protein